MKDSEKVLESFKAFAQVNSIKTCGVFNGLVVGFGPKGIPGRMCGSVR